MKKTITYAVVLLLLVCSACKKDLSTPAGCTLITVHNTISSATSWTKGNVYVVDDAVAVEATLTIEPGTIVKFTSDGGLRIGTGGSLQAVGTASEPIIFTAYTDDTYCGDSNGDGSATTPVKGYWGGIRLQSTIVSNLTYCKILYAGADNANAAGKNVALDIRDYQVQTMVDHCTFAHTSGAGTQFDAAVHIRGEYPITFTNNAIYDNGGTIFSEYYSMASSISNTNTFHNPSLSSQVNVRQGIYLGYTYSSFTSNTTFSVTELPYVLLGSYPSISNGIAVTLSDNVILKFQLDADVSIKTGAHAEFVNGQGAGVIFTSIRDDLGGDSNGDGSATSPAAGDWVGIYDVSNANQHLTWANIINDQY